MTTKYPMYVTTVSESKGGDAHSHPTAETAPDSHSECSSTTSYSNFSEHRHKSLVLDDVASVSSSAEKDKLEKEARNQLNLGMLYSNPGKMFNYDKAKDSLQRSLAAREKLGMSDADIAPVYEALGNIEAKVNKNEEAKKNYTEALKLFKNALKEAETKKNHASGGAAGALIRMKGNDVSSPASLKEGIKRVRQVLMEIDPSFVEEDRKAQGKKKRQKSPAPETDAPKTKAKPSRRKKECQLKASILHVLEGKGSKGKYDEKIPSIKNDKDFDLAEINFSQGDFPRAILLYEKCLEAHIEADGYRDVTVQLLREKLAMCSSQMNDREKAITYYEDAMRYLDPGLLRTRIGMSLGQMYIESNRPEKALEVYSKAIPSGKNVSKNSAETMRILSSCIHAHEHIAKEALKEKNKGDALEHYILMMEFMDIYIERDGELKDYFIREFYVPIAKTIGDLYVETGNYEDAVNFQEQFLRKKEKEGISKKSKKEQKHIAIMYHNMGILFEKNRNYRAAKNYYIKSLEIKRRVYDVKKNKNNRLKVGHTVLYIAFVLYKLEEDEGALKYFEDAIKTIDIRHAKSHFSEYSFVFQAMVTIYVKQNKLEEAVGCLQDKVRLAERCSSGNYKAEVAECHNRIGSLYHKFFKYEKAIESHETALHVIQEYNTDHEDDAAQIFTLKNLASCYFALGKNEKALQFYQDCLEYADGLDKAVIFNKIGILLSKTGRPDEALEYYGRALQEESVRVNEEFNEVTVAIMNNQANVFADTGNDAKALAQYKKASDMASLYSGIDGTSENQELAINQELGITYNMGLLYMKNAAYGDAITCFQDFLEPKKRMYIEDKTSGEEVAAVLNNIGNVKFNLGYYEEATDFFEQSLEIKEKVFGKKSPELAISLSNLGTAYYHLEEYDEALDHFENALKHLRGGSEHSLVDTDLKVATLWNKIGNVHSKRKDYDDAIKFYEKALRKKKIALGNERCPEVLLIKHNLALVNAKSGLLEEALDDLEDLFQKFKNMLGGENNLPIAKLRLDMAGVLFMKREYHYAKQLCFDSLGFLKNTKLPRNHPYLRQANYTKQRIEDSEHWATPFRFGFF